MYKSVALSLCFDHPLSRYHCLWKSFWTSPSTLILSSSYIKRANLSNFFLQVMSCFFPNLLNFLFMWDPHWQTLTSTLWCLLTFSYIYDPKVTCQCGAGDHSNNQIVLHLTTIFVAHDTSLALSLLEPQIN